MHARVIVHVCVFMRNYPRYRICMNTQYLSGYHSTQRFVSARINFCYPFTNYTMTSNQPYYGDYHLEITCIRYDTTVTQTDYSTNREGKGRH